MLGRISSIAAIALLLALNGASRMQPPPQARLTLWAWERPERLTFVSVPEVGVAYLAATIYLDDQPVLRPRLQPLQVNPETPLTAVIRLESMARMPARVDAAYTSLVADGVLRAVVPSRVQTVQIDFDAIQSQRAFYRELLQELRARLPSRTRLSITALGSWCLGDDWIAELPIDEAVPMLFRMGIDRANIIRALEAGGDFHEPLCRGSVGISTDEPWPRVLLDRNVYVFNPHSWTPSSFTAVQRKLAP
jgi:hypothetical protein